MAWSLFDSPIFAYHNSFSSPPPLLFLFLVHRPNTRFSNRRQSVNVGGFGRKPSRASVLTGHVCGCASLHVCVPWARVRDMRPISAPRNDAAGDYDSAALSFTVRSSSITIPVFNSRW